MRRLCPAARKSAGVKASLLPPPSRASSPATSPATPERERSDARGERRDESDQVAREKRLGPARHADCQTILVRRAIDLVDRNYIAISMK